MSYGNDMASIAPPSTAASSSRPRGPGTLAGELRVALTRVSRRLRSERGEAELPEGQFSILSELAKHKALAPGALAEFERVKPPSMTRAVNALAELGLVRKDEHATDRRQVVVVLTEAGEREVRETKRRRDAWLTKQLATLTADERATLDRAAELLVRISRR